MKIINVKYQQQNYEMQKWKIDILEDEAEDKDNEEGDIFLLFKKGFEQSNDKINNKLDVVFTRNW